MKKLLSALIVISPLVLSGCVIAVDRNLDHETKDSWQVKQETNKATIMSLEIGQGIELIKSQLGAPDFYEVYQQGGNDTKILYYRTHRTHSDSQTTKNECHFLEFKNNTLVSIGNGENAPRRKV